MIHSYIPRISHSFPMEFSIVCHHFYPLVNIQKAIENGPVEIVDFPIKNGDFPWQNGTVHQRVPTKKRHRHHNSPSHFFAVIFISATSSDSSAMAWDIMRKIAIEIVDLPIKNGDLVGFNGIY